MKKLNLTRERQERFLRALAETGIVTVAVEIAGTSRTRVYELRKHDPSFMSAWDEAEDQAADALEAEAWRRAVVGVQEPLVLHLTKAGSEDWQSALTRAPLLANLFFDRLTALGSRTVNAPLRGLCFVALFDQVIDCRFLPHVLPVDTP